MTQEQESYIKYVEKDAPTSLHDYVFGFQRAWRERINSVWHSAQDMPSRNMRDGGVGELCLVEISDGDIEFVQACYESINGVYYFKAYFGALELFKITRWAYVKDLMPAEE